jgi:hypothetical protein
MFEFNSRRTKFPRGYGLPGRVWKSQLPLIANDLEHSKAFLRWQGAMEIGIDRGFGIPYSYASDQMWVTTFLSTRDIPIARRLDIWAPYEENDALSFHAGDCAQNEILATEYQSAERSNRNQCEPSR